MSASSAPVGRGAQPPVNNSTTTLRTLLEARRTEGRRFALPEAVATIVPLCLDLQERHARGERLYVHPACVAPGADGLAKLSPKLAILPQAARDRSCLAPELQSTLAPGDAKSSVFSLGAILYEMITGVSVGPGMPRPREVDPSIPVGVELLLEKALIADPSHRPDDIGALASALYHSAPGASLHPPEVDPKNLDHTVGDFEVDVRLSLMAPEEVGAAATQVPGAPAVPRLGLDPYGAPVSAPTPSRQGPNVSERLSALKAHLESDPRPRYVVNKDKMDHGPFSAVELLQQIASHTFTSDHLLRDELSGQTHPIKDWEQFAPFAQQSALKREIVAEEKAVRRVVQAEKKGAAAKGTIAIAVVGAIVAAGAIWFVTVRGSRKDDVEVADDPNALDLSLDGGVHGGARRGGHKGGGGGGGGGGGFSGGMSYEAALASNNTQITIGQAQAPDLTDTQLAGPMRNASFLNSCGAPESMKVTVRVAIRMGRAVGVSVYTNPPSAGVASCVDRAVRNLSWPANGKMDTFTTTY
jgi:hypothetical protein